MSDEESWGGVLAAAREKAAGGSVTIDDLRTGSFASGVLAERRALVAYLRVLVLRVPETVIEAIERGEHWSPAKDGVSKPSTPEPE